MEETMIFDPKEYYSETAPELTERDKKRCVGEIVNLFTIMIVKEAPYDEMINLIWYSRVVIDANKDHLDWKLAYNDFGIRDLRNKYKL